MTGLRVFIVLFVVGCVGSIHAGQFFERNSLAIDGYDPVAYFAEQKPMKGSWVTNCTSAIAKPSVPNG
jgi:hypothetical protein